MGRLVIQVRKEANAADDDACGRTRGKVLTWATNVVEGGAAAHNWLKKHERRQLIQAERACNTVVSTPGEPLNKSGEQWNILWAKGWNRIDEMRSISKEIRAIAVQEAYGRATLTKDDVKKRAKDVVTPGASALIGGPRNNGKCRPRSPLATFFAGTSKVHRACAGDDGICSRDSETEWQKRATERSGKKVFDSDSAMQG